MKNIQVLFSDSALRYKGETIKGNILKADKAEMTHLSLLERRASDYRYFNKYINLYA